MDADGPFFEKAHGVLLPISSLRHCKRSEAIHLSARALHDGLLRRCAPRNDETTYAAIGRCARRNECTWRSASGIRSFGCFHGNMLTSAFGASIAASIATA